MYTICIMAYYKTVKVMRYMTNNFKTSLNLCNQIQSSKCIP